MQTQSLAIVLNVTRSALVRFWLIVVGASVLTKLLYDTFRITLLFESILLSTLLVGVVQVLGIHRKTQSWKSTKLEFPKILLAMLLVFNLMFFSLMMVDRSKSLYVVRWIGDCPGLSESEILFEVRDKLGQLDDQYLQLRIREQVTRSIVYRDNNKKLHLSVLGKAIYSTANTLSLLFGLEGWTEISLDASPKCV